MGFSVYNEVDGRVECREGLKGGVGLVLTVRARAFQWPPSSQILFSKGSEKEFSWLCFIASISLTVIKNNAESGPELSFPLLRFLPLACCHSLRGTRDEDRSHHLIHLPRKRIGILYNLMGEQQNIRVRGMCSSPHSNCCRAVCPWARHLLQSPGFFMHSVQIRTLPPSSGHCPPGGWARHGGCSAQCPYTSPTLGWEHYTSVSFRATWDHVAVPSHWVRITLSRQTLPHEPWGTLGFVTYELPGDKGIALPFSNILNYLEEIRLPLHQAFGHNDGVQGPLLKGCIGTYPTPPIFFPLAPSLPAWGILEQERASTIGRDKPFPCSLPYVLANLLTNVRRCFWNSKAKYWSLFLLCSTVSKWYPDIGLGLYFMENAKNSLLLVAWLIPVQVSF